MGEPDNKDKIKEILEGHNKKFTPLELIVGIIVILIIGSGIGYAIFKLLTPSQTVPPKAITEIQQTQIPPVSAEESKVVKEPKVKTSSRKQMESVENGNNNAGSVVASNSVSQPSSGLSKKEEMNTQPENTSKAKVGSGNTTEVKTKALSGQEGLKIIPPQTKSQPAQGVVSSAKNNLHKAVNKVRKSVKLIAGEKKKKNIRVASHVRVKRKESGAKRYRRIGTKTYVLQVSSNRDRKLAILTVVKLRKCGHKAYTKEVEIKGQKYTRVYVGPIKGYSAAKLEAKEIKRQLRLGYLPIIRKDD